MVLASASAGILPSFVLDDCRFMQALVNSAGVRLMQPNELDKVVIEGNKENPIELCDESGDDKTEDYDSYVVDGVDVSVATSTFDPDAFLNETIDQPLEMKVEEPTKEPTKEPTELNVTHRLPPTKTLAKAKR